MELDIYVSANTENARYGKAETLARVMGAYADHTYLREHTVIRVNTGTGSWEGVTENVVILNVEGKTRDIISLMSHMASYLDQECVMGVERVGTGGNARRVTSRSENDTVGWNEWTVRDGMGQPRYTYSPDWQHGEYNVWFTNRKGESTPIGK